jgi:hypothetical protein
MNRKNNVLKAGEKGMAAETRTLKPKNLICSDISKTLQAKLFSAAHDS